MPVDREGRGREGPDESGVPSRIARYDVLRMLGQGGMGQVYLARDPRLKRDVALKVLTPEYAADGERLERFRREARIASSLNHPHICTIHDIGEEADRPYIVMELVEGRTLVPVEGERLPLARVLEVGAQVARALAAAHEAGVVHRDIKPGNVMVRADGYVKVVDFGLARPIEGAGTGRPRGTALTESGTLVGTVRYMSPEQACGRELDGASDIFSLGVVLYELATGSHPFQAASHAELIQAILAHTPLPADRIEPAVPAAIAALLARMLARESALRPSAREVASELEEARRGRAPRAPGAGPGAAARHTVGRERERQDLLEAFDGVSAGRGFFVCVTGEPGIGKSTLMEDFLGDLHRTERPCAVARGRCSERLAGTEAYLPVLEALEGLLHGGDASAAARTMKAVAPSWYAQVASVAPDDSSLARALREGGGVSQERLKREFGALAQELSRPRPLVLLFDDVHWADASTVDLLAYLGARCKTERVLCVLSYRPTDLALAKHPFGALKLDLQARRLCREIALSLLTREDVQRYLDLEFPGHAFPAALGDLVHARTEGSPLFMADLLRYLRDRDVLVREGDRWTLGGSLPDLAGRLPESVRSMVQRKIEQLGEDDLRLLVAASVQGHEFDALVVAEALGLDAADVEDRLHDLDRVHTLVTEVEERELPDRALTLRYRFVHVLYQNALYATLRPTRRAALSRAVAEALLRHHGEDSPHVAAELALLFESARDFGRAAEFFLRAARHAVRLFANREAAALARKGLDNLEAAPRSEERDRTELALLVTLGPPLKDTRGWAAPEVGEVYRRANELGERIAGTPDLFPALWGMWMTYSATADIETLKAMGRRLLKVAEESGDTAYLLQAHHALSTTYFVAGEFTTSLHHSEQGSALYDPERHGDHCFVYGGHDPGSCCASFASQSLWALGYPDRSLEQARRMLEIAADLGHPVSLALAHWIRSVLHLHRREPAAVREHAEACRRINLDQGAPIFPEFTLAWADAAEGHPEASLERMGAALGGDLVRMPLWWQSYFHGLMAEVSGMAGRFDEALASIAKVHEIIGDRNLDSYTVEVKRLEGEFLHASSPARSREAERVLRDAVEQARRQKARMLELRATVSLGQLLAAQGRAPEIRPSLADLYGWFTEGFDTWDLKRAKDLLGSIS